MQIFLIDQLSFNIMSGKMVPKNYLSTFLKTKLTMEAVLQKKFLHAIKKKGFELDKFNKPTNKNMVKKTCGNYIQTQILK